MKKYPSEVADFVSSNKLSFSDDLLKLCNYELDHKVEVASKSMIKAAAFPFIKTIGDYDFDFQPKLNKQEILELTSLKFIEELKNIASALIPPLTLNFVSLVIVSMSKS